jgi:hypothetical protein
LPTKNGKELYAEYVNANNKILLDLSQKMGEKKYDAFIKLISAANKILTE